MSIPVEREGEGDSRARRGSGEDAVVGREPELGRLREFVASSGDEVALLVEGAAGIGKTTLWKAGIAAARGRGQQVLGCAPAAAESTLSYGALGDLLSPVLHDIVPPLPPPQRQALEIALLLRRPSGPPPDQRALGLSLVTALRELARSAPVLVAIDDAQWVDPASAAALEFAVRRLEGDRIKVLAAVRVEEKRAAPLRLDRVLGGDGLVRVRLGPLSLGAVHRLLRARLGIALPRPALLRVHEASGGNPFFALEIARAVVGSGGRLDSGRRLAVPDDLDELLSARFAGLSETVCVVLAAAAAMADPTVSALMAVAEPDRDVVVGALDVATTAGIVGMEAGRVRFTHPLLASSVYWRIDDTTRRRLHRRLATAASDVEEQARHLALAAAGPDEDVAAALDTAARHAAARGTAGAAAELAELATRLTPVGCPEVMQRRQAHAAERFIDAGDLGRARQILEGLRRELPPGAAHVDVLLLLARTREDDIEAQGELLEMALREAGDEPRRLTRVLRRLADAAAIRGDQRAALVHARAAVTSAEQSQDVALLVSTLAYVGLFETYLSEITPGLLERAADLEATVGYLPAYESPSMVLGYRRFYEDRFDEARRRLEVAVADAAAHSDFSAQLSVLLHLAELEVMAGNWERAGALAAEGLELAEQLDADHSRSALLYVAARADAHLGRVDTARAGAIGGAALARASKSEIYEFNNQRVLGFVQLSLGDHAGAVAALQPLLDLEIGSSRSGLCAVLPDLVEALVGAGDVARARELADVLERNARGYVRPTVEAMAARCRGLLHAAERDPVSALAAFEDALRMHDGVANPFERARTLLALGETQRRARQRRAARQTLESALAVFEELGARLWADRARQELTRIGGRAPAVGGLSPTEERVAALVADGCTNRQAASALHLSEHTIEGHLSRIYAKLGVRSRTELARRLTRDGTEAPQG